jgi:hypothetical protein
MDGTLSVPPSSLFRCGRSPVTRQRRVSVQDVCGSHEHLAQRLGMLAEQVY